MAQGQDRSGSGCIVSLTPEAEDDRLIAYLDTEQFWGTDQANNYDAFLISIMQSLAEHSGIGSIVENVPNARRYLLVGKMRETVTTFFVKKPMTEF